MELLRKDGTLEQELRFLSDGIRQIQGVPSGYAYASLYEYVLEKGRGMESRSLSSDQKRYLAELTCGEKYPTKECFSNSQRVLVRDFEGRLAYYEGYATTGLLPVLHGWLVLDGEVLVDLTWRRKMGVTARGPFVRTRVVGEIPDGFQYLGLEVANREAVWTRARETQMWATFLDDWKDPFLRVA